MRTTAREETSGPLGVIGCLAAGFEVIGRNLWLIALPVLLDLLLWLGPRLSVAPLLQRFGALLTAQAVPDPAVARQIELTVQMLELLGERFNLFALLGMLPLLNVPSLLAQRAPEVASPLGKPDVVLIADVFTVMGLGAVLIPVGLMLGTLYLNSLARQVRAVRLSGQEGAGQRDNVGSRTAKFLRVFLFGSGLVAAGVVSLPLWVLLVGTVASLVRPLGLLLWLLGAILGGYVVLHLLFVIPGVLLGGRGLLRAIWESVVLIHTHFPSVIGLILLVQIVYQGLGFVWSLPSSDSWSLLVGILGNGCLATGLTAALFVFYQERIGRLPGGRRASTVVGEK